MSEIKDLRERCPVCKKLTPEHTRWCGAFSSTGETEEVEVEQSIALKAETSEDKVKGFF